MFLRLRVGESVLYSFFAVPRNMNFYVCVLRYIVLIFFMVVLVNLVEVHQAMAETKFIHTLTHSLYPPFPATSSPIHARALSPPNALAYVAESPNFLGTTSCP